MYKQVNTNDCWLFAGTIDKQGYGRIKVTRESSREVHRLVYLDWIGEIPKGLVIDHLCRNRSCINPEHLDPVTIKENILRGREARFGSRADTECGNGHKYKNNSFYVRTDNGSKRCRQCENLRHKLRYHKVIK